MKGINTGEEEVRKLTALIGDIPLRIDLIDTNGNADPMGRFEEAGDDEGVAFFHALQPLGAPVVRRYSVGRSESSACAMPAATRTGEYGGMAPPRVDSR